MNTMNFPTQDEDRESIDYAFSKPIDVESLYWVKRRMKLLEVRGKLADRISLFDEFYCHTQMKGF